MSKKRRIRSRRRDAALAKNVPRLLRQAEPPRRWSTMGRVAGLVAIVALAIAWRVGELGRDPRVAYLVQEDWGARWIRPAEPFVLTHYGSSRRQGVFRVDFAPQRPVAEARLLLRAFRRCEVMLDGKLLFESSADWNDWKVVHEIRIPGPIDATPHRLLIRAFNLDAHVAIMARCEELNLRTSGGWAASHNGENFAPALVATDPIAPELAGAYPTVAESLESLAPWLGLVFAVSFCWAWWTSDPRYAVLGGRRPRLTPPLIRAGLLCGWVILAANNIWRLPISLGYDQEAHFDYVRYIAEQGRLPLASDGWQMFQSPLAYLLSAPSYAICSPFVDVETLDKILRVLPLLCGLAQIELIYRIARVVFPRNEDLQSLATVIGGLMPMQIYMSQVLGNEPLAAALTSVVLLFSLRLLSEPRNPRSSAYFFLLGLAWGLALLSKVTPVLLAPWLVGVTLWQAHASGKTWVQAGFRVGALMFACAAISGWYFVRNWLALGTPFAGGWDPRSGNAWWQDPSYRTWEQFSSFGLALERPVFSGVWSLWDSLYSSMWLDGFLSGRVFAPEQMPWNISWMTAGAWLGLTPMVLIALSLATVWTRHQKWIRVPIVFAQVAVAIYVAALIDLYARLPVYSTAKASYMLGMLPCLALMAAAGAAPLLRMRWLRAALYGAVTCWAVAAYLAYFSLK